MTFLGSLLIALLALIFDFILGIMEKRLTNHKRTKYKVNFKLINFRDFHNYIWSIFFFKFKER